MFIVIVSLSLQVMSKDFVRKWHSRFTHKNPIQSKAVFCFLVYVEENISVVVVVLFKPHTDPGQWETKPLLSLFSLECLFKEWDVVPGLLKMHHFPVK